MRSRVNLVESLIAEAASLFSATMARATITASKTIKTTTL